MDFQKSQGRYKILKIIFRKINNIFQLYINKKKWRKYNSHNDTSVGNIFPLELAKVGKYTYGVLNIKSWGTKGEGLEIGNYVSIGPNVTFALGGNHYTNTITTFPFKVKYFDEKEPEALTKGKIIVEDDVWIGMNTLILSGVKIGKGAIIGAGAVVAKDIPSYAIAVGNPCKVVKYRFSNEIQEKIKNIELDKITEEHKNIIYKALTEENINRIREQLNGRKE